MQNQLLCVFVAVFCVYYIRQASTCNTALKPFEQVCSNGTCVTYSLLLGYWCDGKDAQKMNNANVDTCKSLCAENDCSAISVLFSDPSHPVCQIVTGTPSKSVQLYTACYLRQP
ncbi:hypothetical protein Tcan_07634 [Toxocara canis]|uniref:Apple domain-containing protein n=1 Tax=Toxocara canis TaxID=6265 RepID=A0A0B2V8T2_TOXCA|nr:hypothetical protein Tcan_07634 [Toxocara canis]